MCEVTEKNHGNNFGLPVVYGADPNNSEFGEGRIAPKKRFAGLQSYCSWKERG
jgi:hypothetical protein